ncbi:hypothetical protein NEOLI_004936 [Neolecta irregularis DAH-3]|uniref:Uncharacterized protein n=1 Tax=Neolecta irregularis (strain DAH-3) TaxID=1198029 RepID=A0A1U7LQG9_NEOID|nr:hypothetical protein NEOLI_004936 [Neolecta irregularis DAH-3]|eukprot:OLL24792.1 hypothetical protein NEOLI_004936 [Neolecta irregularis DAH-3]
MSVETAHKRKIHIARLLRSPAVLGDRAMKCLTPVSMRSLNKGIRKRLGTLRKSKKAHRVEDPTSAMLMDEAVSFYSERNVNFRHHISVLSSSPLSQVETNPDGTTSNGRQKAVKKSMLDSFFSITFDNKINPPVETLQVYGLFKKELDNEIKSEEDERDHTSARKDSTMSSIHHEKVDRNPQLPSRLQKRAATHETHDSLGTFQGQYFNFSGSEEGVSEKNLSTPLSERHKDGYSPDSSRPDSGVKVSDSLKRDYEIYDLYLKLQKNPPTGYRHEEIDVSRMNDKQYFRHVFMLDYL